MLNVMLEFFLTLINRKIQSLCSFCMSEKKKALMTLKKGLENTSYINTGVLFHEQTALLPILL